MQNITVWRSKFVFLVLLGKPPVPAPDRLPAVKRTAVGRTKFCARGRMSMRTVSKVVSIALSVIVFALPLSACLTPAAQMSKEQRECCQKMAGRCETSVMPSSHSCCQHPVSRQALTASKIQRSDFGLAVVVLREAASLLPQVFTRSSATSFECPPESPPQIVIVLRI